MSRDKELGAEFMAVLRESGMLPNGGHHPGMDPEDSMDEYFTEEEDINCVVCESPLEDDVLVHAAVCDECFEEMTGFAPDSLSSSAHAALRTLSPGSIDADTVESLLASIPSARTASKKGKGGTTTGTPAKVVKPFNPLKELQPLGPIEARKPSFNIEWHKDYPLAERLGAPCAFPDIDGTPSGLTLVVSGNTVVNLEGALQAWKDAIGEPLPAEAREFLSRVTTSTSARSLGSGEVTEHLVNSIFTVGESISKGIQHYSLVLERNYVRPETAIKFSASYYGRTGTALPTYIVEMLMVLSLPAARQEAGVLSVDVIIPKPAPKSTTKRKSAPAPARRRGRGI